jgi:outer membrane protein OmpA-like peptidoglycan-associated protein
MRPYVFVSGFCVAILAVGIAAAQPVKPPRQILRGLGVEEGATSAPANSGGRTGATVDLQVQFEYNSAQLTPQAVAQLEALAQALTDPSVSSNRFRIEGHTDADGSAAYNQTLSERRAQAVKQFLIEHGVGAPRLQARGFGESKPIADENTAEGKALDRRVAVVNLGKIAGPATAKDKPVDEAKPPQPVAETKAKHQAKSKPTVDVVVQYERNGQKQQVKPGTVLRPVDNFNVSFTPTARSYVYVFKFDTQGSPSIVFPNKEYSATVNPVVPQRSYVVPSDGRWLRLTETPGEEEIVVLASGDEIDDPRAVAQAVRHGTRGMEPYAVTDKPLVMPADLFSYRLPYKTQLP